MLHHMETLSCTSLCAALLGYLGPIGAQGTTSRSPTHPVIQPKSHHMGRIIEMEVKLLAVSDPPCSKAIG